MKPIFSAIIVLALANAPVLAAGVPDSRQGDAAIASGGNIPPAPALTLDANVQGRRPPYGYQGANPYVIRPALNANQPNGQGEAPANAVAGGSQRPSPLDNQGARAGLGNGGNDQPMSIYQQERLDQGREIAREALDPRLNPASDDQRRYAAQRRADPSTTRARSMKTNPWMNPDPISKDNPWMNQ